MSNVYMDRDGKVTITVEGEGHRLLHRAGDEVDDGALNGIREGLADEVRKAIAEAPDAETLPSTPPPEGTTLPAEPATPENKAVDGPPEDKTEDGGSTTRTPRRS